MAKITKIEVQKNNKQKVNIYVDGEYYNRLYLDTCVKFGIKVGTEIDEEKFNSILFESEKSLSLNLAINYVGSVLKTRKQVKDYLKRKDVDDEIIEYVLSKLEEYRYIDDEQFVKSYISSYSSKYGKKKLEMNLRQKGIKQSLIDEYMENELNELKEKTENVCLALARKKAKGMDLSDMKNFAKLSRFLVGRGFDFDEINSSINIVKKENR